MGVINVAQLSLNEFRARRMFISNEIQEKTVWVFEMKTVRDVNTY